jgi:hypothetical protein
LHEYKPLWDFMTAVGTIALALVTFFLATRKPKALLSLSVERSGPTIDVVIRNTGEVVLVPARFYWTAPCINGQIDIGFAQPGVGLFNGAGPVPLLQNRLTRGDTVQMRTTVQQLAELSHPHISANAPAHGITACMRESRFVCVTTTGEHFEVPTPEDTAADISARVNLIRHPL